MTSALPRLAWGASRRSPRGQRRGPPRGTGSPRRQRTSQRATRWGQAPTRSCSEMFWQRAAHRTMGKRRTPLQPLWGQLPFPCLSWLQEGTDGSQAGKRLQSSQLLQCTGAYGSAKRGAERFKGGIHEGLSQGTVNGDGEVEGASKEGSKRRLKGVGSKGLFVTVELQTEFQGWESHMGTLPAPSAPWTAATNSGTPRASPPGLMALLSSPAGMQKAKLAEGAPQ